MLNSSCKATRLLQSLVQTWERIPWFHLGVRGWRGRGAGGSQKIEKSLQLSLFSRSCSPCEVGDSISCSWKAGCDFGHSNACRAGGMADSGMNTAQTLSFGRHGLLWYNECFPTLMCAEVLPERKIRELLMRFSISVALYAKLHFPVLQVVSCPASLESELKYFQQLFQLCSHECWLCPEHRSPPGLPHAGGKNSKPICCPVCHGLIEIFHERQSNTPKVLHLCSISLLQVQPHTPPLRNS